MKLRKLISLLLSHSSLLQVNQLSKHAFLHLDIGPLRRHVPQMFALNFIRSKPLRDVEIEGGVQVSLS